MLSFSLRFGDAMVFLKQEKDLYSISFNKQGLIPIMNPGHLKAFVVEPDPEDPQNHVMFVVTQGINTTENEPYGRLQATFWFSQPAGVVMHTSEVFCPIDLTEFNLTVRLNKTSDGFDVFAHKGAMTPPADQTPLATFTLG